MLKQGVEEEIAWGCAILGDEIPGLNKTMIRDYIRYLGNLRAGQFIWKFFIRAKRKNRRR